ncbi:unnamed protein product [Lactuca virosa]|uniref:Ubiquitin-like protease family profile domain-containing protein n=1 Tax=Lactuca virosa TaxID=75947 RepID=A0AAU9PE33_9ASTR|nr:unnamed protein product [Lactuca virosa]
MQCSNSQSISRVQVSTFIDISLIAKPPDSPKFSPLASSPCTLPSNPLPTPPCHLCMDTSPPTSPVVDNSSSPTPTTSPTFEHPPSPTPTPLHIKDPPPLTPYSTPTLDPTPPTPPTMPSHLMVTRAKAGIFKLRHIADLSQVTRYATTDPNGLKSALKPNNEPIRVMADATELMLPFYVRYVNWTLNHEESPPRQHSPVRNSPPVVASPPPRQDSPVRNSPPVVASPPRRKMYKSETYLTESATYASSSQHPEIERTYTSCDTSTKVVKKKKTSTKALVKRLLGVVADLSSKVDRVLQKKDEPNTRFVEEEEEEEMINEDEEEAYYHGTQFEYGGLEGEVGRTPTHGEPSSDVGEHHSKTVTPIGWPQRKRAVAWYQRTPFTVILFVINVVGAHWFMAVLHLDTWKVDIYDSTRPMDYFSKYLTGGEFKSFGDSIISELDAIEYWNDFPVGHKDKAKVEFIDVVDAPQQEYSLDRGDCGVSVCMFMEMIVSGVPVKISTASRDARFLYKHKMTNII